MKSNLSISAYWSINGMAQQSISLRCLRNSISLRNLKKYLTEIGGTYYFRKIAGSTRLSMHTFGISEVINIAQSNYWQRNCGFTNEEGVQGYKNRTPMAPVQIFEKHGFI
jgi:hypothetical protein